MRRLFSLVLGIAITTACGGRMDEPAPSVSHGGAAPSTTYRAYGGVSSTTIASLSSGSAGPTSGGVSSIPGGGLTPISPEALAALYGSNCNGWVVECEVMPVARVFVVDLSDALTQPGPSGTNWEMTRSALLGLVSGSAIDLPTQLNYFPNRMTQPSSTYSFDVGKCIDSGANLNFSWVGTNMPVARLVYEGSLSKVMPLASTGAPILDAYQQALDMMAQAPPGYAREIVLVTAGRPTLRLGCLGNPPEPVATDPIIKTIGEARVTQGIYTAVVGTWGSQADPVLGPDMRSWLSLAARAGGTAEANCSDNGPVYCHVDLTAVPTGQAVRLPNVAGCKGMRYPDCTLFDSTLLGIGGGTLRPELQQVVVRDDRGTYLLSRNDSRDCEFGWRPSATGTSLELCNLACSLWLGQQPIGFEVFTACDSAGALPPIQ